jgi:hypothetical protein
MFQNWIKSITCSNFPYQWSIRWDSKVATHFHKNIWHENRVKKILFRGTLRSGIKPFRGVRFGRIVDFNWKIDLHEFHRYWPAMGDQEEAERKKIELIRYK